MDYPTLLGNLGISATEVEENHAIFGPTSARFSWGFAKTNAHFKSFFSLCVKSALSGDFRSFIDGVDYIVERVELCLFAPKSGCFSPWIIFLDEYKDCISYTVSFFEDNEDFGAESKRLLSIFSWIFENIEGFKNIIIAARESQPHD